MGQIIPQQDLCNIMPAWFMQLLASCVMEDSDGNTFLNITVETPDTCDCTPVLDCNRNHLDPETVLRGIFKLDQCGNLALNLGNCDGTAFRAQ